MTGRPLTAATDLTRAQYDGRACVWCRGPLWRNAVSVGISRGRIGAHVLDIVVYACPLCAEGHDPQTPRR